MTTSNVAAAASGAPTIPVGGYPWGVAINPAGTDAYVTDRNGLSVVDLATNAVTATIPLGAYGAYGVAINPAGTYAYVMDGSGPSGGNGLSVVDLATNSTTAIVGISEYPAGVAVNPAGTDAYVTNGGSDSTVSVIDLATNKVTDTIPVGDYPNVIAINPAGTYAYVTDFYSSSVSVINIASADIALAASGPAHATDGTTFTENYTVTNHGPDNATGVATNIYIPSDVTVTAAPGATIATGSVDWVDPSLAAGTSVSYAIAFTVDAGIHATATLGGVAEGDGTDPNPANNAAIITIQLG